MLTYREATVQQRDAFLALLREKTGGYLEPTLRVVGMTRDEFTEMVRTVGEERAIVRARTTVGFVWIERRDRTLCVHGVALEPSFRGQGIGAAVFRDLEEEFRTSVDTVELGVHESNPRARALYERLGFRVETALPEIGFSVLQELIGVSRA